jgi:hypothetical protein
MIITIAQHLRLEIKRILNLINFEYPPHMEQKIKLVICL